MSEYPINVCPECGKEQKDMDGFGLLVCEGVKDGSCGFCSHPSSTGTDSGEFVCDVCGKVEA